MEGTSVATSHMWGRSQQQVSDLCGVARQKTEKCSKTRAEKSGETFSMMPHFPLKKKKKQQRRAESALPLPLSCPIEERSARFKETLVTRHFFFPPFEMF